MTAPPDVAALAATIRATLPLENEWHIFNDMPAPYPGPPVVDGAPRSYLEFLAAADGFVCGPVVMFNARLVPTIQFLAGSPEGVPVQIDRTEWFCAGVVNDEPWFIRRSDESVWHFPDTGVIYWMSDRFEQVAPSLERFFLDVVCGPGYVILTGAVEHGHWWEVLSYLGRV